MHNLKIDALVRILKYWLKMAIQLETAGLLILQETVFATSSRAVQIVISILAHFLNFAKTIQIVEAQQ